jgi:chitodextrinase
MTTTRLRGLSRSLGLNPKRRAAPGGSGAPGDVEAPSVPQNLSATAVSSSQIDLTWDASTDNVGVAGYNIYRDDVLVDTSPTNSYSDTGLASETSYEYEVSAFDAAANESARSDPDSATTAAAGDTEAPSVPQNLSAAAISDDRIDLTWDASTDNVGVTGYNIYRDDVLVDTSPTNAYADTGLDPATEYEYEVSAFDAESNESARSAPDSATTHQVIVTAGLIAEWRFDQGAGQVLTDYSGQGHHGQLGSTTGTDAADPTWTAQGLSFDGGDRVVLPSLPAIQGIDIVFNSDATINAASSPQVLLSNIGRDDECGIALGNMSGGITDEIVTVAQHTDVGYASIARRYWSHASDSVAAGGWHLLQSDWLGGAPYYDLVLDGTDKANATSNAPEIWKTGIWAIGDGANAGAGNGFTGDIAYLIFYSTARTPAQQAQNRAALTAILAGRGITLP